MIILEYCSLDVFRPGLLAKRCEVLGRSDIVMAELQQLLFPWRDIVFCHAATDTSFSENSRSSHLTSQRPLD